MIGNVQTSLKFRGGNRTGPFRLIDGRKAVRLSTMAAINNARIQIIGPDPRGGFVVEFLKHNGMRLAFVVPPNADNDVLAYFQQRMPYGLAVPDLDMPFGAVEHSVSKKRPPPPQG